MSSKRNCISNLYYYYYYYYFFEYLLETSTTVLNLFKNEPGPYKTTD